MVKAPKMHSGKSLFPSCLPPWPGFSPHFVLALSLSPTANCGRPSQEGKGVPGKNTPLSK